MLRSPEPPKTGDLIDGKYQILRQLGAGGMGVVFEAVNRATEKRVALKFLSAELSATPEAQARFEREAKATGRVHHPNVVAVHDYGKHEDRLYMVLELLQGKPLRDWLGSRTVSLEDACRVMFPVMRGVAAAHGVGVLHRDLKPDNIFLADLPDGFEPVPKVLDFGLAKLFSPTDKGTELSVLGVAMGTYQYMAPEQLRARGEEDARTDVYALGTILFSMVAGRLPYTADNPIDLALQMLESEPPLLDSLVTVPAGASTVIARALSFRPPERFASVAEFAVALEPFSAGLSFRGAAQSVPISPIPPSGRVSLTEQFSVPPLGTPFRSAPAVTSKPAQWPWVLSIIFGGTALVLGAWLLFSRPTPRQEQQGVAALPAALPSPPMVDPAPVVTQSPRAPVPSEQEEGATFIERVPLDEPPPEEQVFPDARPAPGSSAALPRSSKGRRGEGRATRHASGDDLARSRVAPASEADTAVGPLPASAPVAAQHSTGLSEGDSAETAPVAKPNNGSRSEAQLGESQF